MQFNKNTKLIIVAVIVLSLTIAGIAVAASVLTSNHLEHPDPLPTRTPEASPTPTVTVDPSTVTLTANDTDIHYNDYIEFTVQLDQPLSNVLITYYNNGTNVAGATYYTDVDGKAVFTRGPYQGAYDIHVTATIP
ncbi:MAG: hypothetical protein WC325_10660 [Candidatus Bathyarchaeia archaeon]|jgi:hypothetical protein